MGHLLVLLDGSSMYRFLKWLTWIAGVCFVLVVVTIVAVQIFLSSDEAIRIAERGGRKILGRKISIKQLELGLFKIKAAGIVIEGQTEKEEARGNKPFMQLDEVELLLNPSTLLYKRISILQLTIRNASVLVRRNSEGRFNFQDIIDNLNLETGRTASVGAENTFSFIKSAEASESVPQGDESGFSFIVHELDLYDVKTEFRLDAGDGAQIFDGSCSFAHVEVDKIMPGEPLDVFLDGKCRRPDGQRLIALKGDARINLEGPGYRASFEVPLLDSSFLPAVVPVIPGYRFKKGIFAGTLKFVYVTPERVAWDVDMSGRNIHADFQTNPISKWRSLTLPELKLKTKGRFNPLDDSVRVETLFVDTPFLDAKLAKPLSWNVSAKDQIHVEANVRDMREAGKWLSRTAGIKLRGFQERATARILVSAKRDRRISNDFFWVEVDSRFDPVEIAGFSKFILPGRISKIRGTVGGKARMVFVSGERVRWDAALETRNFSANVKMNKKSSWKAVELGKVILHSRGNFETKNGSAYVETLRIQSSFASAKLLKPAKWNIDGNDEAEFSIDMLDFSSANDLLERLGLASFGDVPRDAKLRMDAVVSRNRKNPSVFEIDAKTRFAFLPIASFLDWVPLQEQVQNATGLVSGELQVNLSPKGPLRWKLGILGRKLVANTSIFSVDNPLQVSLESVRLRSNGSYLASKDSAEIQTLDLKLPFARVFLDHKAFWNQRGRDEFSLTIDVTDLNDAEVWLGKLVAGVVTPGTRKRKLKIRLSGTRDRRDGSGFYYKGSASFDPIRISPWVKFASIPPVFRNPSGEISGKIEFSYASQKRVNWNLGVTSGGLSGKFHSLMSRDWRPLRTGKFRIETVGFYDFRNRSVRLQRLNLNLPFGNIRTSRPSDWNINGMNSGRFLWSLSNLKDAARFAESTLGAPVSGISVAGTANGSMEFSRTARKARSLSTKWSVAANLSSLAHAAYPNLQLTGSFSGRGDDDAIKISIAKLKTIDFRKPDTEPDIFLQNLKASLDYPSIWRGEIRSPSVRIDTLRVRYVRKEQGQTNFGSLFETATANAETVSGKRQETRKEERGLLFQVMKIGKFEVARMGFYFQDFIAADKPPVVLRVPDARLTITNLDTLMAQDVRETRLELRTLGELPSFQVKADLNPGSLPPDVDGIFNLSGFDLRKISPYVRDNKEKEESVSAILMRGTEITSGELDFKSTYSLRKSQLNLEGTAEISGLRLKPDETFPLIDLVVKLLRKSVFRLFERPGDTTKLNVRVTGSLDDPEFHVPDAIVESLFVNLLKKALNLGGNVKDIVTGILGAAIKGVQKLVPKPEGGETLPKKGSEKEAGPEGNRLKKLGKGIEETLQKGLRDLFGVK